MEEAATVLVVEDEVLVQRAFLRTLQQQGYTVVQAMTGRQALEQLRQHEVHVCLVDLGLPDMDGLEVIREINQRWPHIDCVVITGQGTVERAFECMEAGAADYFEKPINDHARFHQILRRACEVSRLRAENHQLAARKQGDLREIVGHSPEITRIKMLIGAVARSRAAVLVEGETGTGKEVVAHAIHQASGRTGPFRSINCSAIPEQLFEGELFGAVKGAYTGADRPRKGIVAEAEGGTLFLDEIGSMPLELQPKLLRVLETGKVRMLGSPDEVPVDFRVVAATQDIDADRAGGKFREDLFFRISTVRMSLPPLCERSEDIPILTYFFVKQLAEREGRPVPRRIASEMLRVLTQYHWPGNVRELRQVVEASMLFCHEEELELPPLGLQPNIDAIRNRSTEPVPVPRSVEAKAPGSIAPGLLTNELLSQDYKQFKEAALDAVTTVYLEHKLRENGYNITHAASAAGIQRPNFKRLMKRFGVEVPSDI